MRIGAAWLLVCAPLCAQPPLKEVSIRTHSYTPPSAILRAESNLVETALTVRDARGNAVSGLHASDFEVLDNGVPQRIASFSQVGEEQTLVAPSVPAGGLSPVVPPAQAEPQPKFVTFFFDDLHISNGSMLFMKQAARKYIAEGIRPGDRLSLAAVSGQGELDFTTDAKLFADRLEHLSAHIRPVTTGYCGVGPIDSYIFLHNLDGQIIEQAIGAAMKCAGCSESDSPAQCRAKAYSIAQTEASTTWEQMLARSLDTISALNAAAKRLSQSSGTRILVLISSGFLLRLGVPPELQSFIDAALRWNITVNAIGAQGLEARMTGPKDLLRSSLPLAPIENIANGTGGRYIKDTNDLAGAMKITSQRGVSYLLAFNTGSPDGKFHTLKIRFASKRAADLQYRPGYFSPDPKKESSPRARMDDAVFSNKPLNEIPVTVGLSTGQPNDGTVPVSVRFSVDVTALRFNPFKDRHMQQLVFLTALFDPQGNFVGGQESIMDLAVTDEKLASLQKTGLTAITTLRSQPGNYQIRAIVREGMKGKLAAVSTPVELPAR